MERSEEDLEAIAKAGLPLEICASAGPHRVVKSRV